MACRGCIAGDVMKSISLLLYNASEGVLEPRAQDYASNWMSAVAILDDDTYLGAENGYNLFTVRKNSAAASDDDRRRLEVGRAEVLVCLLLSIRVRNNSAAASDDDRRRLEVGRV